MFKRIISLVLIFSLYIGISNGLLIASAKPTLAYPNVELEKLKNVADFKLLTPSYSVQIYKLEINEPYPLVLSQSDSKVRLHFFDASGETYLFAIEYHKAVGHKINQVVTSIDIRNQTSTTRNIGEDLIIMNVERNLT
ncbi:hypothetical protein QNH28_03430 [Paenibacillus sp. G2S3]|uniref:hypothetical protein n=1 Tax=Paenibacillus sp. G2S3 TaxID=3047872 RepID=UPI0024C18470|nr:hypothetical protein [Paenibacillus sp. G2S3]WHY20087.1 hypothetical protein QNH28_03430 [Paenibacillus sp. G2S3]